MSDTCVKRIVAQCDEEVLQEGGRDTYACEAFSVCLPFGASLHSEDGCIYYDKGNPPADGWYSKIRIQNGCITGVALADLPLYTGSPCAPVPCDCGSGEGGGGAPSTTAGNLFTYDAAERPLVLLSVKSGAGISITGDGTVNNPLLISSTIAAATKTYVTPGNSGIEVDGSGTAASPYEISHPTNLQATVNGMVFDAYGHLIRYTPPAAAGTINGITPGAGMDVAMDQASGIATVARKSPLRPMKGAYSFGGYTVTLDDLNDVYTVVKRIDVPEGTYRFGLYNVGVDNSGSITEIEELDVTTVHTQASAAFVDSASEHKLIFNTAVTASFHITLTGGGVPINPTIRVDGRRMAGVVTHPAGSAAGVAPTTCYRYELITDPIYAPGQHTVEVEGAFTGAHVITIALTTAL